MFLAPTKNRLIIKRAGRSVTSHVPKPTVIIDTREQQPFRFRDHMNWIDGEVTATLPTGDYSVVGMEQTVAMERKSFSDVIQSLTSWRARFIRECERMALLPYKCILIEATYEDLKSPYRQLGQLYTDAHPNGIVGSLDAIEARYGIPIIYTSQNRQLAQEKAASWLSKIFTYNWLEVNGYGRCLQEGDL